MGRKVHPFGFRIGTVRDWTAKWHADKHFVDFLQEDLRLRKAIGARYTDAGVSLVEIERPANRVSLTIHTSRPGIVIGRGGQRVDETRRYLEDLIGKRVQLNIQEVAQPELDAYLVARMVAEQIERRIAYRRAMKQAIFRTMQAGAKGIKISCAGRLGGVEIARRQVMHQGRVPLHTLRADIDYGCCQAHINMGRIGVKVWIYRGDILPELKEPEVEEAPIEAVAAKVEEKPVEAPAVEVAEVVPEAKAEEKPVKPKKKRAVKAKAEEKPVEALAVEVIEVAPEAKAEEKPAKPRKKRTAKAKPLVKKKSEESKVVKKALPSVEEEKDAATQTGEVSQES